jgi:hypothetical protein
MNSWKNMPAAGVVVVVAIIALFILSLIMLFYVCTHYRRITAKISKKLPNSFLQSVSEAYAAAYRDYGEGVNTPAIIDSAVSSKLSLLLFCERFLNNAVSLFVTLGLFGTFLGLSLSVSSLTELISYSNTSEWLSVLDSVGEGLMSALSGMGVAFYTSLVGVACSILLTVLRSVFSPQAARETLITQTELWLDHIVAPQLPTNAAKDDATLVRRMIEALDRSTANMDRTLTGTTNEIKQSLLAEKAMLDSFTATVKKFNEGVHDFGEVDYNLRGTVERLDVSVRDLTGMLRRASRDSERKDGE